MRPNSKNVKVGTIIESTTTGHRLKVASVPENDNSPFTASKVEKDVVSSRILSRLPFKEEGWDDWRVVVEIEGFDV